MDRINDPNNLNSDKFSWRVSLGGALGLLVLLPIVKPDPFLDIIKFVPDGIGVTLIVTLGSIFVASIIAILVGIGRSYNKVLNRVLSIYVEIFRGIPLLVQVFYVYFVLGRFLSLPREGSAILALSLCYGAYMAEIVRAGIISIPRGQIEAATALGMNKIQIYQHVIIPQAFRIILPPFGNEFIMLVKDSSLVSIIAVSDLMRRGREYASATFNYFEAFTIVALMYLVLTLCLSKFVSLLEARMSLEVRRKKTRE